MNSKKTKKPKSSQAKEESLLKKIKALLQDPSYSPMSQSHLMETLGLSEDDLAIGKKIITSLLCEGFIETKKKKLSLANPSQTPPLATGTLRMHPRGFGFVIPDPTSLLKQDVFIPKHLTDNAVDGDIVEIAVYPSSKPDKGPEGKVINIVKRTRSHLAGIIRFKEEGMRLLAHIPLFGAQRPAEVIAPTGFDVKVGDRVILKVNEWGGQNKPPLCEISHLIGHITDPTLDIPAAIEEFSLRSKFPTPSIEQAKSYGDSVSEMDKEDRLNLTEIETFTIDPDTAKDFDDALSLAKDELGYTLMVHIADVAHYVPQGSALDKEAFLRGNSTYFPGKCVPMLPEELSNNLCSLRPNVDRLCISVIMNFDFEGTLSKYQIHRSVIHSKTRFTYEEAKEILDEKKKSSHAKTLMLMKELCLLLKKKRYSRGSIDFALPEVVLEIDPQGMPTGFKIVEYDLSHQLVEEFMLKANEVVAKHLADQGKPLPYRIHEEPAPDSMEDFGVLARSLGFPLKDTSLRELQSLFEKAKDTPFAQQLSIAFIRSMKLAAYSAENIGHFGLSLEHYCHFTSPIRRYPDLVVQRLLFNQQPLDSNLELISLECSEKERLSFKAEMSVKTLKKLRLLKKYLDEDPDRFFDASISKIKPFGLYFEIAPYSLEGFLHISELEDDFFIFDAKSNSLLGEKKKIHHRIGDKIQIELLSVDFILQESKWRILGGRSPKSSHPPKPLVKKKKEKRHPKEKKHKRKRKS